MVFQSINTLSKGIGFSIKGLNDCILFSILLFFTNYLYAKRHGKVQTYFCPDFSLTN